MGIHIILLLFTLLSSYIGQDTIENSTNYNGSAQNAIHANDKYKFDIDCSIRAIEVENETTCWFAGDKNTFGFTKNSGESWQSYIIEYDSLDLQFRSIAMTPDAVFVLSIGSPALIFKIDKQTLKYELVYKEVGEKVFYDSMKFWDNENGIAVGDPTENCMSVLLTKDGGYTWNKLGCEHLPSAQDGETAFAASNTNISLVENKAFIVTGGKAANILIGNEFGNNWVRKETPIIQGESMTGIFSTHFLNPETGVIAGGNWEEKDNQDRAMAITFNGGNNWQVMKDNPGYISCVQFVPNQKALWACSTNGIFYSKYLGESWKKVSDEGFYSLRISENGERLYFSGNNKLMSVNATNLMEN